MALKYLLFIVLIGTGQASDLKTMWRQMKAVFQRYPIYKTIKKFIAGDAKEVRNMNDLEFENLKKRLSLDLADELNDDEISDVIAGISLLRDHSDSELLEMMMNDDAENDSDFRRFGRHMMIRHRLHHLKALPHHKFLGHLGDVKAED